MTIRRDEEIKENVSRFKIAHTHVVPTIIDQRTRNPTKKRQMAKPLEVQMEKEEQEIYEADIIAAHR
jgi:hypothetical protein